MATRRKPEHFTGYYIRTKGVEIGPFRTREAAVAEAKAIRKSDPNVKITTREVTREELSGKPTRKKGSTSEKGKQKHDDDEDDDLFDDDDDEDEDDDLFDDDDEDDEDEDEDEDDEPPSITHPFYRKLGGKQ